MSPFIYMADRIKHVFLSCSPMTVVRDLRLPTPKILAEKLYSARRLKIVTATYLVKILHELQVACGRPIGIRCFTIQSAFGFKVSNFSAAPMVQLQVPLGRG